MIKQGQTRLLIAAIILLTLGLALAGGNSANITEYNEKRTSADSDWIYSTNGVHSNEGCNNSNNNCISKRNPSDPKDASFPNQWISDWTMYTVLNEDAANVNPPPYTNPPVRLKPDDYLVSYGTSYYDNSYQPENPSDDDDYGAMLEYYKNFCLPIFGKTLAENQVTCAFASLGKKAYYLTFNDDHSVAAPTCCQFSPSNHPPRPDFLKYLDYWPQASTQLNGSVQAYYWQDLWQADSDPKILFAYAFNKEKSLQGQMPKPSYWYQRPQSFFFSGMINLGNAKEVNMISPIISQNYSSFRIEKPDPDLWREIAQSCPAEKIKKCHLFPGQ